MLDNSKPQKDVLHFMLPKNTVMQVADQVNKNGQASTSLMTFTVQPGGAVKGASPMTGTTTMPSGSGGTNSNSTTTTTTSTKAAVTP